MSDSKSLKYWIWKDYARFQPQPWTEIPLLSPSTTKITWIPKILITVCNSFVTVKPIVVVILELEPSFTFHASTSLLFKLFSVLELLFLASFQRWGLLWEENKPKDCVGSCHIWNNWVGNVHASWIILFFFFPLYSLITQKKDWNKAFPSLHTSRPWTRSFTTAFKKGKFNFHV